jgi:DNA-binding IclR family transcriptional regulator
MRPDTTPSNAHALGVLPGAAHLRRVVGPTAWVVLEALLQNAEPTSADEYIARRSIRDLAADLGLAKDTVARALRVLRDVGLISHDQHRADAGTFDPGRYAFSLPSGVVTAAPLIAPTSSAEPRTTKRATTAQLSLAFEG